MTQTLAVDANNDLYIGSDDRLTIVSGMDAVLQNCAHAAKTLLGEMLLAVDQGLPYFQSVWIGIPNIPQFEAALREALLAVDGVLRVATLDVGQVGNQLNYTAEIVTVYGTGSVDG